MTEEEAGALLQSLGLHTISGHGQNAVWAEEDGTVAGSQIQLVNRYLGAESPYRAQTGGAGDTSPTVDGAGVAYIVSGGRAYKLDGTPYAPIPVPVNQHPGFSSSVSSSTSQSFQDPAYLEILRTQGKDAADQFWAKINADAAEAQRQRDFTASQTAGNQTFQTGERVAGQDFTAGQTLGNQQFTSGESLLGRQFTSGESAIDRAQRAGEFAANYAITKAQAQRADREAALTAAKTYTDLSASPDLTGYQRFLSAGGGSLGGALQRGATSLTREGQLGAARALQVAEQPLPTYADYNYVPQVNPYAGLTNPALAKPVQQTPSNGTLLYAGADGTRDAIGPAAGGVSMAPTTAVVYENVGGGSVGMGPNGESPLNRAGTPEWARYAFGTQGQPATGTFITGDSTDPMNPAAGGARPEAVTVHDPPGPNNASADVQPLVPPTSGDRTSELAAMLSAISRFLSGGDTPSPVPAPLVPDAAPRYAFGTDTAIQPGDNPYIDTVLSQRASTQFDMNPYRLDYFNQLPTQRAINETGAQTALGVPIADFQAEAQRYKPGGLNRDYVGVRM